MTKRDERLCDTILLRLKPNEEFDKIRRAEKFKFDRATTAHLIKAFEAAPPEALAEAIPEFAILPYPLCWVELPQLAIDEPDMPLIEGFLYTVVDETLQRGFILPFSGGPKGVRLCDYEIFFDFRREFDDTTPPTIYEVVTAEMAKQKRIGAIGMADVDGPYAPIIKRFCLVTRPETNNSVTINSFKAIMEHNLWMDMLAFMMLNMPKEVHIVDIVKENLDEYNKQRRRLGQPKSQRQAFHVVTINMSKTEPSEALAAILAKQPIEHGTHASPGEHDVRGHWRTYRSGLRVWIDPHKRGHGPCRSIRAGYQVIKNRTRRSVMTVEQINRLGLMIINRPTATT